jgi:two-component system KDP operon response regulator KdpE
LLSIALGTKGWTVFEATSGFEGIQQLMAAKADLVLLDLNLPDMDGAAVLTEIRKWSSTPVIVLSVRGSQEDIVNLLNLGADDYITKPFYTNELTARVEAVYRRRTPQMSRTYRHGELFVDLDSRQVLRGTTEVHLTVTEFALLELLLRNAGKIVTREMLLKELWGPGADGEEGSLRVHIRALRRKLESDPEHPGLILTEPGIGYRMALPDTSE